MKKINDFTKSFVFCAVIILLSTASLFAQLNSKTQNGKTSKPIVNSTAPKITQIDEVKIKELLKPNGKPLLINFWATWCIPCREEFPDLVRLNEEYKGKIDFITITLDDLAEIDRDVPKFLTEMKAMMPTYLLYTNQENEVIGSISKDWEGALPFTILYNENGDVVHTRQGKIKPEIVRSKINNLLTNETNNKLDEDTQLKLKILREITGLENPSQKGIEDAKRDIKEGKIQFIRYGESLAEIAESDKILEQKYNINFLDFGCKMTSELIEYIQGYNKTSKDEIKQKFDIEI